jgi:hypothetical protein
MCKPCYVFGSHPFRIRSAGCTLQIFQRTSGKICINRPRPGPRCRIWLFIITSYWPIGQSLMIKIKRVCVCVCVCVRYAACEYSDTRSDRPACEVQACHVINKCLKLDGTRAETGCPLSAKRTSPFKSAGASAQSPAGSRGVHIRVINAGYTTFRGSVRVLATHTIRHFPLPCLTVCHQVSITLYLHLS